MSTQLGGRRNKLNSDGQIFIYNYNRWDSIYSNDGGYIKDPSEIVATEAISYRVNKMTNRVLCYEGGSRGVWVEVGSDILQVAAEGDLLNTRHTNGKVYRSCEGWDRLTDNSNTTHSGKRRILISAS